jgi:hypothetical protein
MPFQQRERSFIIVAIKSVEIGLIAPEGVLAIDDTNENGDYRDDKQNVDEPADGIDTYDTEQPEYEQDDGNCCEHV